MIQSAWLILRLRDSAEPLKVWAEAVAHRRGKAIAVVALARRLAGVLWAMWRDGTVYDPAALGHASAQGIARNAEDVEWRAQRMAHAAAKVKYFSRRSTRGTVEGNV